MKHLILITIAFTFAACGGESEAERKPLPVVFGDDYTGGSNDDDFCQLIKSVFWCDDADGIDGPTASSVHSQAIDTEPNDEITNAVTAHWPRNFALGQRIGFGVQGGVELVDPPG